MSALLGMSLQIRQRASPNQAGPSHQRIPVASRSMLALYRRYLLKLGSRLLIAGSGERSLGSHPPNSVRANVPVAAVLVAASTWRLVLSITCLRIIGHDPDDHGRRKHYHTSRGCCRTAD